MGSGYRSRTAAEEIKEAEEVRNALCDALHGVGIVLPSLWIEPGVYAEEKPRPLIELGRCNLATARKLTTALQSLTEGA